MVTIEANCRTIGGHDVVDLLCTTNQWLGNTCRRTNQPCRRTEGRPCSCWVGGEGADEDVREAVMFPLPELRATVVVEAAAGA
jgi:hypothetical protein